MTRWMRTASKSSTKTSPRNSTAWHKTHTTAIKHLLEDFNDDQMLLQLDAEAYESEPILIEKEPEALAQTSTANVLEEAAKAPKEEEEPQMRVETEQGDALITEHIRRQQFQNPRRRLKTNTWIYQPSSTPPSSQIKTHLTHRQSHNQRTSS